MNEKQLKSFYNKHIKNQFFYRVISEEYLPKIKKQGLTPENNPFESFKKELRRFYTLIENKNKKISSYFI